MNFNILLLRILVITLLLINFKSNAKGQAEHPHPGVTQYENNYFSWRVLEIDRLETTFQLSIKKRLVETVCAGYGTTTMDSKWCELLFPLHFGMTQKALWYWLDGWNVQSWPIVEIRNNPELYYDFIHLDKEHKGDTHLILKAGVEHESNGKTGNSSRAWNWAYLQVSSTDNLDLTSSTQNKNIGESDFSIKFLILPFGIDKAHNEDIVKQLGNTIFTLSGPVISLSSDKSLGVNKIPIINNFKFSYVFSWSTYFVTRSRSLQTDILLSYGTLDLWSYIQNWIGTGQWLDGYDEYTNTWRVGLVFK